MVKPGIRESEESQEEVIDPYHAMKERLKEEEAGGLSRSSLGEVRRVLEFFDIRRVPQTTNDRPRQPVTDSENTPTVSPALGRCQCDPPGNSCSPPSEQSIGRLTFPACLLWNFVEPAFIRLPTGWCFCVGGGRHKRVSAWTHLEGRCSSAKKGCIWWRRLC